MLIDNASDAEQRYRGMLGLYDTGDDKEYIIVHRCFDNDNSVWVEFSSVLGSKFTHKTVKLTEALNMTKFNFGYMYDHTINRGAYITRTTLRETRQGLSANNTNIDSSSIDLLNQERKSTESLIFTEGSRQMLLGNFDFDIGKMSYLAFLSAEEQLPRTHYPVSKCFSLIRSNELQGRVLVMWKGSLIVGEYLDEGKLALQPKHSYLEDQLARCKLTVV